MRRKTCGIAAAMMAFAAVFVSEARADIIFSLDQGSVNPAENLLFIDSEGNPVSGATNKTATVFDIYSNETLVAEGGQARVYAKDGEYDLFFISPDLSNIVFSEFEANVNIIAGADGTAVVTACNQQGNFNGAGFTPLNVAIGDKQPCESFSYTVNNGENFFVLSVADSQLLTGVRITTDVGIVDVRQIRLTPLTSGGQNLDPVPEPASLLLFSTGLAFAGRRLRQARKQGTAI